VFSKFISSSVAIVNSFVWNRRWTFRAYNSNATQQLIRFIFIQGLGVLVVSGIFALSLKIFGLSELISYVLSVGAGTIWNFSFNKWWAFRS
jgi:putative flippase GtrA